MGICNFDKCSTRASFGIKETKKPLRCKSHKEDYVDIVNNNICIYENCGTRAGYNYKNIKKGSYCVEHKLSDMFDVNHKICLYESCELRSSCNYENIKIPLYCSKHKLNNMFDVCNKKCLFEGCKITPIYNYKNEITRLYCVDHKLDKMVDIHHKLCIENDCETQPLYNYTGLTEKLYCVEHKLEFMIDVAHKTCKNDFCGTRANRKYKNYCGYCYVNMFPKEQISRNYKTKETAVVDYIKDNFPNVDLKCDKTVYDGCSRRRPDILLDLGFQVIIIEIDEFKHQGYSCENKRIMEISQDVGHRSIIFIRFNPDNYKDGDKKITSCWSNQSKSGINTVKKCKIKEWEERLLCLKNEVEYWLKIENKTDKMIEIVELYYDK